MVLWLWSSDLKYSAQSAYRVLFVGCTGFPCHKILWKAQVPLLLWLDLMHPSSGLLIGLGAWYPPAMAPSPCVPRNWKQQSTSSSAAHGYDNFEVSHLVGMAMALPSLEEWWLTMHKSRPINKSKGLTPQLPSMFAPFGSSITAVFQSVSKDHTI